MGDTKDSEEQGDVKKNEPPPKILIVDEVNKHGSYANALLRLPHYDVITIIRGGDEGDDS